jgi:hypothetical protein
VILACSMLVRCAVNYQLSTLLPAVLFCLCRIIAKTESDEGHYSERDAARLVHKVSCTFTYKLSMHAHVTTADEMCIHCFQLSHCLMSQHSE